jgi:hypothetical protein
MEKKNVRERSVDRSTTPQRSASNGTFSGAYWSIAWLRATLHRGSSSRWRPIVARVTSPAIRRAGVAPRATKSFRARPAMPMSTSHAECTTASSMTDSASSRRPAAPSSATGELDGKPPPHRRHHEIFRLPTKRQHPSRHLLRLREASCCDHGSDSRDLGWRHRQLTNTETQEDLGECGIPCHVSTDRDGLAREGSALDRSLEEAEQRGME